MARKKRKDGRSADELRPIHVEMGYLKFALGSALITAGDTRVLAAVSIEQTVPPFLAGRGTGWLTAEYSMLPASTPTRKPRETIKPDGRTQEIRRIIGRSLRSAIDLRLLGERTIYVDCDVIQADGGTRTAAITGAWLALVAAVRKLQRSKVIRRGPVRRQLAAVSVGVIGEQCLLDLNYEEDSRADMDMNIVMTDEGKFIEIQGTAENEPLDERLLSRLLAMAKSGCLQLMKVQQTALRSEAKRSK